MKGLTAQETDMILKHLKIALFGIAFFLIAGTAQAQQAVNVDQLRSALTKLQEALDEEVRHCGEAQIGRYVPGTCLRSYQKQLDLRSRLALAKADLALRLIEAK